MKIEKTTYKGWNDAWRITLGDAEMIVLADVGPRIISLSIDGGDNLLFQDGETLGKGQGDADWHIYGGHRLWVGPETEQTYAPDNAPCKVEVGDDYLLAKAPVDSATKLQFSLRISAHCDRFVVDHIVENTGEFLQTGTIWALTCVAPKGILCFPWGRPGQWRTKKIIYWQYWGGHGSDVTSKQWQPGSDLFVIDPTGEEGKVGTANYEGWVALVRPDCTFIKKFEHIEGADYPDDNCSMEAYACEGFIEMETLSPMVVFYPQQASRHREQWLLTKETVDIARIKDVRKLASCATSKQCDR